LGVEGQGRKKKEEERKEKKYRVNLVDVLPAFLRGPLHPVAVEVPEKIVDVSGRSGVALPLGVVVVEEVFVHVGFCVLKDCCFFATTPKKSKQESRLNQP